MPQSQLLKRVVQVLDSAGVKWATEGGIFSERQFRDAIGVFELQFARLDRPYLEKWATALGVEDLWGRLQAEARPL